VSNKNRHHLTGTTESWERKNWKDEPFRRLQKTRKDGADVTWRGSSFQTWGRENSGDWKSSVADSRQPCTTDDQWWYHEILLSTEEHCYQFRCELSNPIKTMLTHNRLKITARKAAHKWPV